MKPARFITATLAAVLFALGPQLVCAQQLVQAPREDGAQTALRVYSPSAKGCAPLALISPGAGGSEDGYKYLAEALRDDGWRTIVMGHRERGSAALLSDMRQSGSMKGGLKELVLDPAAYNARLMDIAAALKWATHRARLRLWRCSGIPWAREPS